MTISISGYQVIKTAVIETKALFLTRHQKQTNQQLMCIKQLLGVQ